MKIEQEQVSYTTINKFNPVLKTHLKYFIASWRTWKTLEVKSNCVCFRQNRLTLAETAQICLTKSKIISVRLYKNKTDKQ